MRMSPIFLVLAAIIGCGTQEGVIPTGRQSRVPEGTDDDDNETTRLLKKGTHPIDKGEIPTEDDDGILNCEEGSTNPDCQETSQAAEKQDSYIAVR